LHLKSSFTDELLDFILEHNQFLYDLNENNRQEIILNISRTYLAYGNHGESIPRLLVPFREIKALYENIEKGEWDITIFDEIAKEIHFQLRLHFHDFINSKKGKFTYHEDTVEVDFLSEIRKERFSSDRDREILHGIYDDEEEFSQFTELLVFPSLLLFCRDVWQFKNEVNQKRLKKNGERDFEEVV